MTRRVELLALVLLCAALIVELAGAWRSAHAPHPAPTDLDRVRAQIDGKYHDCVPLGWRAERLPGGVLSASTNLDIVDLMGPFEALWVAIVPPARARDPRVARVQAVMDALVDAGLLTRTADPRGERYNVTRFGRQFYYDGEDVTGNVEDWPFLCYSRLRVTSVAWDAARPDVPGEAHSVAKHVRFAWRTETIAAWATPRLRESALHLRPDASPAEATVCRYVDGEIIVQPFGGGAVRGVPVPQPRC